MEHQDGSMPSESAEDQQEASHTAALEQRVAELEDLWRRALAELDNYRKRMDLDDMLAALRSAG